MAEKMNQSLKKLALSFGKLIPDKLYIRIYYRKAFGKRLNLKSPVTYNEKIQWMKLYYRKDMMTKLVDKYEVRKYIADKIGEEYLFPLLGVWDSPEEIDYSSLPDRFVLKCTHDSGSVVVCRDKQSLDRKSVNEKLKKCLKHNWYWNGREWPYKNVKPRIIAEQYMEDESHRELKDYKFFCFDGKPKAFFIATDRGNENEEVKFDFYDMDFNHLPFKHGHEWSDKEIKKPLNFDKMIEIASELSKGWPHVRVDLYNIDGKVYFGEMTFSHHCGFVPFEPEEWDYKFGEWFALPDKEK